MKNGILSQERLAELISDKTNKPYSRNDIGEWEHNKSTIRQNNRELLVALISVFAQCGGLESFTAADSFLITGDYRPLNSCEITKLTELSGCALEKDDSRKDTIAKPGERNHSNHLELLNENSPFLAPPIPPQGIIGREELIEQIQNILSLDNEKARDIYPIALRGMGGIGKTTLAIAVAHNYEFQRVFPDGVLWVSLGPNPTILNDQQNWGRALGVDLSLERDEFICRDRLRAALYQRKMLLVIDDVWETTHGASFLVGGPQCHTLLTTRELSVANDLATQNRVLLVKVLEPDTSLELLNALAPEVVASDRCSAIRLCERLEYLPLAITLAGRLLANEVHVPSRMKRLLADLIEHRESRLRLIQSEGRRGLDEDNPVSLRSILGMSVKRLAELDQERFSLISSFGAYKYIWDIKNAAANWRCSSLQAEDTISRLIQRGLVERSGEHYWMHSLLVDYAESLLKKAKATLQAIRVPEINVQNMQRKKLPQSLASLP